VRGFEDLAFMFSSNQLNHGVASLQFDEAALLFRLARDVEAGTIAEIGRFRGGSTVMFSSALPAGAELWSYDLSDRYDGELDQALTRLGLRGKVHLVVGDSRTVEPPAAPLHLLFIDGDHSYEGARADFDRWSAFVRPGGHVLFHDAVDAGGYGNVYPGVTRAVSEINWPRQPGAGSIAHFVKPA
jgi:predicted O-methyltransferase YrrM